MAALCLPGALLGVQALYLNWVQPVPLVVSSIKNNKLPSRPGERNTQLILWLGYLPGKKPDWWGQRMQFREETYGQTRGYLNLTIGVITNACSYDQSKQQYRVPVHYIVPTYGRWKSQRTISFQVTLRQKAREKGVADVETPLPT